MIGDCLCPNCGENALDQEGYARIVPSENTGRPIFDAGFAADCLSCNWHWEWMLPQVVLL